MSFFVYKSRKFSALWDNFCEHFSNHKVFYLLFFVVCCAGFVVGIISGVQTANDVGFENLPDFVYFKYLAKNITLGQYFLTRMLSFVCMLVLCWVLCINRWVGLLNVLLFVYNGFVVGASCAILIISFKFLGVLNVIFGYLPFCIISLLCLLSFCVVAMRYAFVMSSSGYNVLCGDYLKTAKTCLIISFLTFFVVLLLQILLIPFLSASIIVS